LFSAAGSWVNLSQGGVGIFCLLPWAQKKCKWEFFAWKNSSAPPKNKKKDGKSQEEKEASGRSVWDVIEMLHPQTGV